MRGVVLLLAVVLIFSCALSGCGKLGEAQAKDNILGGAGGIKNNVERDNGSDNASYNGEVSAMRITSSVFKEGESIPRRYTCQGENINPSLRWEDIPPGTKSFALIVDDPDAPMGTWVHWLVKDIPPEARMIQEASVPGKEVENSFGNSRYGGPCPPLGIHRYFFKLYALNVSSFEARNAKEFQAAVDRHKIGEARLMGRYQKV
jgi:Raf kinase inhibitor-like YbhB/YbcL family protein